jgi:hypothetical protein
MNLGKLGLYATGAFASFALVFACSSSSTTSGGTTDGGSSGSTPPGGECKPADGKYTVTYTADAANSATCASADQLSGTEEVGGDTDGGGETPEGCDAPKVDGCKQTTHCVLTTDGGPTNTVDIAEETPSDGADSFTGTFSIVTSGGGVDQTCKYTISGKKQ